ncbi:putative MFS family arabinose efflux permease [Novosphingobium chloroacetimidivorans]|uniref:Putative MFS family arabinose efflux permease n=1 Tax=Novosphingobium chloroacetimidivorans TaxID=1428314 RepID=A0A7W7NVK6_9SPHN|nr:MFS transporter [Novosphingobium chloroacetimidivorans]MBB4858623.1 putative MFS family arabinose efflux permease [Novosphingobium chloroacetimidivorans]
MDALALPSARTEWRRSWKLVLAAAVGFSFMSMMTSAQGLFMGPLQDAFGWSRTLLSMGSAIGATCSLLLSPVFGVLIDRYGSRRLALPGLILTALLIAAFSLLDGSTTQWIALWVCFALVSNAIHATTWTTAVSGMFDRSRGLALGLTLSGSALALAVVPPLTNWLITNFGWRAAFVWLGLGWGGLAFVLSMLFLFDARDLRRTVGRTANRPLEATLPLPGLTVRDALKDWALWRIAIATFLTLTITVGITVHQFPILVDVGVSRANAALLASMAGVAGIVGKLTTGALLDRYHVRWVGGVTLASTAVAYPLLLDAVRTPLLIVVAMMINGYAAGTKMQLCGYLTTRYAGMRNYGTIYGFMSSLIALSGGLGPLLAGLTFDTFGGYGPFLVAGAAISLVSGLLVFSLKAYPRWDPLESTASATPTTTGGRAQ